MSPDLHSAPWLSTYYLGFNVTKSPFNRRELREAIVKAIDRTELDQILKDRQKPSSSWVPTPLEGSQYKYGPRFDPKAAKKIWQAIKKKPDHVELVFDSQEKNNLICAYVQQQLKTNLGLNVSLRSLEWKSYLQYLKTGAPPFFRFAWLAAFPDPLSHLGVFTSKNPNNDTGYSSEAYDHLVDEIGKTVAGPKRSKLIRKAQNLLLTKDVVIFPMFHYVQYSLIRRNWRGLELTPMGLLYFHQALPTSSF